MLPVDYEPVMKASGAEELKDERSTEQARLETFVFRETASPLLLQQLVQVPDVPGHPTSDGLCEKRQPAD